MSRVDRLIVPVTFVIAILAVLLVTVSWVPHPIQLIGLRVDVGPPGIVPGRRYGLSFTPRNPLSGHILTKMVPSQRHCVDVTITNDSLTYIDMRKACRSKGYSYGLTYRFPRIDDYIMYVEMHNVGGWAHAERKPLPLDLCWLRRGQQWYGVCPSHFPQLRGRETVRSMTVGDLTIVLGAPAHAVHTEEYVPFSFVFLRDGKAISDLQPLGGLPGKAVAISMDTLHFTRLAPDPGQIVGGHVANGAVSFTAWFGRPSIYKVFATFRYQGRPLKTSFVVDVNPKPKATPTPSA